MEHPTLAAALLAFQAEMGTIERGRTATVQTNTGGSYSYTYADLADVLGNVRPVLLRHGVVVVQDVVSAGADVGVRTLLLHAHSDDRLEFGPLLLSAGKSPQAAGSAVTYARRYAVLAALGLATEDDEGQAAQREATSRPAASQGPVPGRSSRPPARNGGENLAPGVSNLIAAMNKMPGKTRAAVMTSFMHQFGPPGQLPPERVSEAAEWVADQVSRFGGDRPDPGSADDWDGYN